MSPRHPPPLPSSVRVFLRTYRSTLVPILIGAVYLGWRAWQIRGDDPVLGIHSHVTILVILAAATIISWIHASRGATMARLFKELRIMHLQVAGLTREVAADKLASNLVQGQLEQITGRLDAVAKRVDELHGDAYADGLAARQLRDPKGDPTDALNPQVNGLWLSRGN